jgi:hypothetical protein
MKFRVNTTLKASALAHLGGTIGMGYYDTQSPNFPAELKEVLIAEAENPRGLVECLDPEDITDVIADLKDVSSEVLDDISSGEGKAEENHADTPPLGEQDEDQADTAKAPSPTPKPRAKSTAKPKPVVKK